MRSLRWWSSSTTRPWISSKLLAISLAANVAKASHPRRVRTAHWRPLRGRSMPRRTTMAAAPQIITTRNQDRSMGRASQSSSSEQSAFSTPEMPSRAGGSTLRASQAGLTMRTPLQCSAHRRRRRALHTIHHCLFRSRKAAYRSLSCGRRPRRPRICRGSSETSRSAHRATKWCDGT